MQWLEDIEDWVKSLSTNQVIVLGVSIFLISFFASIAAVSWFILRLPTDYFRNDKAAQGTSRGGVQGWCLLILKNLFGLFLICLGVILSLPGIPGQGVLTILIGVMFLNFPGKRRFEKAIIRRPRVLSAVNKIRSKFNKPLILPCKD